MRPALVPAGMMGDQADLIFASPDATADSFTAMLMGWLFALPPPLRGLDYGWQERPQCQHLVETLSSNSIQESQPCN